MGIHRPPPSPIGSLKEFLILCIRQFKPYKYRVSSEALQHLQLTMTLTQSRAGLEEALNVVFPALAIMQKKKLNLEYLKAWQVAEDDTGEHTDEVKAQVEEAKAEAEANIDEAEGDLCVESAAAATTVLEELPHSPRDPPGGHHVLSRRLESNVGAVDQHIEGTCHRVLQGASRHRSQEVHQE